MRRSKTKTQGFTLLEMMVVVAIIGIVSSAIMPGLSAIMADGRQATVAQQSLVLIRLARSSAYRQGVAYLVRFDAQDANELGSIRSFAGMTSSCMRTDWQQAIAAGGFDAELLFSGVNGGATADASDSGRHVIALRLQAPIGTDVTLLDLCYEPNGSTFVRTVATDPLGRQLAPAWAAVGRTFNTENQGVTRRIVLPQGGAPRFR